MKKKKATTPPTEAKQIDLQSEEDVKIHFALPMLESLGYKRECMSFEKTITVQEGTKQSSIFADIVVYTDKKKETPLIVVDTKAPNEILDRVDREQVISYARLLPKIAPLAVLTNGSGWQVFQTLDKSRIKELPSRKDLLANFVQVVISAGIQEALRTEAKKQLFIIDDVRLFKTLLSRCHNDIRNNEGYEPVKAFDELSKVLFAKMYEEKYKGEKSRFTLTTFRDTQKNLGINVIQQIFKEIQAAPEYESLFSESGRIDLKDRTIESIVETFERYDLSLTRFDVKGEAFEHFLGDTFTGGLGQYFTPRNVVEFIVDAISPKIGDKIIDPFCGTGGFLIYAFEAISEKIRLNEFSEKEAKSWRLRLSNESLYGTDWIERTAQACKMNMIVHGDGNTCVFKHDGFVNIPEVIEYEKFDICLTNPPFGASETNPDILKEFELGQGRKSQDRKILALERCIKLVRPGGLIGLVMDDGVLNNDSLAYVRAFLHREAQLIGAIGLNRETFQGYGAGAKTTVLLLQRRIEPVEFSPYKAFFAVCENTGYAPTGIPIAGNQLPDILFDYKKWAKTRDTDFVHKRIKIIEIASNVARLDAESYVQTVHQNEILAPIEVAVGLSSDVEDLRRAITSLEQIASSFAGFGEYDWIPMHELLEPVEKRITIDPSLVYRFLGMHGKGQGLFVREELPGSATKAHTLNQAVEGWFVYSRLFARNGSFAIIEKELAGALLSGEFPTFQVKNPAFEPLELLNYLIFYLISPNVLAWVDSQCTGSTKGSRARFKEDRFMGMSIPIPKDPNILKTINAIRVFQQDAQKISDGSLNLSKSLESSIPRSS